MALADARARNVGASWLVLCEVSIGQPRTLLRISSGAKSRRVIAPPASRPITSSPACASGSTATPPAAPSPMTTTSVSLSLVAMFHVSGMLFKTRCRLVETFEVVGGLVIGLELAGFERFLIGRRHHGPHARVAEQIPSDEIRVAAVVRVAEGALPRVVQHERKKLRGAAREDARRYGSRLDVHQHGILIGRGQFKKALAARGARVAIEGRQPRGIGLARTAQRSAQGTVDVMRGARFARPRSERVARNESIDHG